MPWEIRWFDNNLSKYKMALEWFKCIDDKFVQEKIREDQYFFLPNCDNIGIKLRPSNYKNRNKLLYSIEIKLRKQIIPNFELKEKSIYGNLEKWIKYSWVLMEDNVVINNNDKVKLSFLNDIHIVKVKKSRNLRRYAIKNNTCRSITSNNLRIDEGLQCELTKITENEQTWWSLGFEGFGEKNQELIFRTTVGFILKDFTLKLDRSHSFGYPKWLNFSSDDLVE
ncbi:MAG: hypothetical protein MRJ93_03190 [Nitrososphaeraceae archaeon]|nr:hypothetical protein [Nitrososphaeraceae archaeon]